MKLVSSIGARGVVLVTGGLATDRGLMAAMSEVADDQEIPVEIRSHPDSVLAGAIGAALWGAFRARRLAEEGVSLGAS
jgi:benzoyl-CoA reductase subunit D